MMSGTIHKQTNKLSSWVLWPAWESSPRLLASGRWQVGTRGTCSVGWSRPPVQSPRESPRSRPPSPLGNHTSLYPCVGRFPIIIDYFISTLVYSICVTLKIQIIEIGHDEFPLSYRGKLIETIS